MSTKQISLTMPESLFQASKHHSEEHGYLSLQELILDLLRRRVMLENAERYRKTEQEMKRGRGKRLSQKEAVKYVKGL